MPPVEIHLRIRVKPGGRDALHEFLREAIPYYEAPGGIAVRLLADRADDHRFIEIIEYASERAYSLDQHRVEHDPEMKALLGRWRSLLAEPSIVEVYTTTPEL